MGDSAINLEIGRGYGLVAALSLCAWGLVAFAGFRPEVQAAIIPWAWIGFGINGVLLWRLRRQFRQHQSCAQEWRTMACVDPLTGVSNRRGLESFLQLQLDQSGDGSAKTGGCAVVVFDLDHFKAVNDRLGHLAGDRLLQQVARVMSDVCRDSDIVARTGGDEFVLVLPSTRANEAECVGHRVVRRIQRLPHFGGIRLNATFGVAIPEPGDTADQLIDRADQNLFGRRKQDRSSRQPATYRCRTPFDHATRTLPSSVAAFRAATPPK